MMEECEALVLIGKKIKETRIGQGLTLEDLAFKCDFEKSNLSRIENGLANPTIHSLCRICRALNIQLARLFIE